jgi:serine phosphatase RsbU (regulator of sigma subunit)
MYQDTTRRLLSHSERLSSIERCQPIDGSSNSPGEVLKSVNDPLVSDIPPNMFVTCFYAILDPKIATLSYANAGHDLPYLRRRGGECGS